MLVVNVSNMKKVFIVLLFIFSGQLTWAQDSTAFVGNEQIYIRKNQYRITFPRSWKRNLDDLEQVVYMGPSIDSGYFKNDGSFGLNISKIPNGYTTKEAMRLTLKNIEERKTFSNYKVIEENSILINSKPFEYVIFQVESDGVVFTSVQFYLVDKNVFYILGSSLPSPTLGKYREVYFSIAKTFVIESRDCGNKKIIERIFLDLNIEKSNEALMKELKARPGIVYDGTSKQEVPGTNSKNTFADFIFTKHSFVDKIKKGVMQFQDSMFGEKASFVIYFYSANEEESKEMYDIVNEEMMKGCFEVEDASTDIGSYKSTMNLYEDEDYLVSVSKSSDRNIFTVEVSLNLKE